MAHVHIGRVGTHAEKDRLAYCASSQALMRDQIVDAGAGIALDALTAAPPASGIVPLT